MKITGIAYMFRSETSSNPPKKIIKKSELTVDYEGRCRLEIYDDDTGNGYKKIYSVSKDDYYKFCAFFEENNVAEKVLEKIYKEPEVDMNHLMGGWSKRIFSFEVNGVKAEADYVPDIASELMDIIINTVTEKGEFLREEHFENNEVHNYSEMVNIGSMQSMSQLYSTGNANKTIL